MNSIKELWMSKTKTKMSIYLITNRLSCLIYANPTILVLGYHLKSILV